MLTKSKLSIAIHYLSCASVVSLGATTPFSIAQESSSVIDEIVVTARKRTERLQDVPLSVTALSGDDLTLNGAADLAGVQSQVPGLTIYPARGTSSTATVYIRGIGQSDPLWGVEPGIGIYVDDVYLSRPQGALLNMLDVERIEVLRGPQGTLYGRNTIGGAIKYITKQPSSDLTSSIDVKLGSDERIDVNAYVSGGLTEHFAASFAVGSFTRDGYGQNAYRDEELGNKDVFTWRGQLLWTLSDTLNINFALDKTEDKSALPGADRMLANPYLVLGYGLNGATTDDFYDANYGVDVDKNADENSGAAITLQWDISPDVTFKSVTAYREGDTLGAVDFDLSAAALADSVGEYFNDQTSQEFQLNYDAGGEWQWVAGVYWLEASAGGDIQNSIVGGTPAVPLNPAFASLTQYNGNQGQVDTESYAAYVDATWQLTDQLSLGIGGRYTSEEKSADVFSQLYVDSTFTSPAGIVLANFTDSESWNDFSPKLSVDYALSDDLLLYATASEGFKSGGFNIRANTLFVPESALPYDPETVTTFELGIKSSIGDNIQFNVAAFNSDYQDVQVSVFTGYDSSGDGNNDSFFGDFLNAAEATISGIELEYIIALTDNLRLQGNAAYLDAEYDEYLSAGIDIADQTAFTNTPKYTYSINAIWDWVFSNSAVLTSNVGYAYRDDVQPDTTQSDLLKQAGYGLWNATLSYASASDHWVVALEGQNLSDERYLTSGYDLRDSGFPIVDGYYGAPRTWAARLTYRY